MKHLILSVSSVLVFTIFAFGQGESEADKAIRDAIATLKKKQTAAKSAQDKAKIAVAIDALKSVLAPKETAKVVGDGSKVTRENYGKIKINDNFSDVEAILGKGKEISSSGSSSNFEWRSGPGNDATVVSITFEFRPVGNIFPKEVPLYTRVVSKRISGS